MQNERSSQEEGAWVPGWGMGVDKLTSQKEMQEKAIRGRRIWRRGMVIREPVNLWFQIPRGTGECWRELWAGNKEPGTSNNGKPRVVIEITGKYRELRYLHRFRTPILWSLPDCLLPESKDHLFFLHRCCTFNRSWYRKSSRCSKIVSERMTG